MKYGIDLDTWQKRDIANALHKAIINTDSVDGTDITVTLDVTDIIYLQELVKSDIKIDLEEEE